MFYPAYAICHSGSIWKRTIDTWPNKNDVQEVAGMPKLFTKIAENGLELAISKVFDEIPICGTNAAFGKFYA